MNFISETSAVVKKAPWLNLKKTLPPRAVFFYAVKPTLQENAIDITAIWFILNQTNIFKGDENEL